MKTWSFLAATLLIGLVCLIPSVSALAQDATPTASELWTANFDNEIKWQMLTDVGNLLVCTVDGLQGINPETGATAWTLAEIKDIPIDYVELIPETPYAAIARKDDASRRRTETLVVDVTDGRILWTTKDLSIANSQGQFFYPPTMSLLMYGRGDTAKSVLSMVDLNTGTSLWTKVKRFPQAPGLFPLNPDKSSDRKGIVGNQPPVILPDSSFLEFWSKNGLRRANGHTGDVMWTSKLDFKEVPALYNDYAPIQLSADGQIAYVAHDLTVDAIQISDGKVLWEKGPKLLSKAMQMAVTPQGLVVSGSLRSKTEWKQDFQTQQHKWKTEYTKPYLTVLDPATGQPKWKKPFRDLLGASAFVVQGDQVIVYTGFVHSSLVSFNIADGTETTLVKKVKFAGGGDPEFVAYLEIVDGDFLLQSAQELFRYNGQGSEVYHNYHKQTGSALLRTVGKFASGISASTSMGGWNIDLNNLDRYERPFRSNPSMRKRIDAFQRAANFTTVVTPLETADGKSSPGLVKIDKTTGKDVMTVDLGTKKPGYVYDGIDGRLFFLQDDKTIVCYSF